MTRKYKRPSPLWGFLIGALGALFGVWLSEVPTTAVYTFSGMVVGGLTGTGLWWVLNRLVAAQTRRREAREVNNDQV